jgi:hypothetical protein
MTTPRGGAGRIGPPAWRAPAADAGTGMPAGAGAPLPGGTARTARRYRPLLPRRPMVYE